MEIIVLMMSFLGKTMRLCYIDDYNYENNTFDSYGFHYVARSINSAEEDCFSDSDIKRFCDENVEEPYYCLNSDDEEFAEEDNFQEASHKTNEFKKKLLIPHGKDIEDSLLYVICYVICF